jgi:hypothetical protein
MTRPYPVDLDVVPPARFERVQLALRLTVGIVLGFVGVSGGWLSCLLYLALPVFAAIAISNRGAPAYLGDTGAAVWRALTWVLQFWAYMMLLSDRFPVGDRACTVELRPTGAPTPGTALLRLITSIPAAFVQCILAAIGCVLAMIGWITILVAESVPAWILRYQHGVLRGAARLLGYHASLVEEYPPFGLDLHAAGPPASVHGGRL